MPALAAAVTPIMKLLVVVETLNGNRMMRSIARTLRAPEPMPSRPESSPAMAMSPQASPTCWGEYAARPCATGQGEVMPIRVAVGAGWGRGAPAGRPRLVRIGEDRE